MSIERSRVAWALRNPVVAYLIAGSVVLAVVTLGASLVSARSATDAALAEARRITELVAISVVEPALTDEMVQGDLGAVDRFDRRVRDSLLAGDARRVKIWSADGRVLYSDQADLVGRTFDLTSEQQEVLADGTSAAAVSDLDRPENVEEADGTRLLEVYARITSPSGEPLLFEAYFPLSAVESRRTDLLRSFGGITAAGLGAFLLLTLPLVVLLTRALRRAATERERLLTAASDASAAERRRIARDLHDGVVQDLAATGFTVSAMARQRDLDEALRADLTHAGGAIRESLRGLRSLMVEIHPPDLTSADLLALLNDLVAPASDQGVEVAVDLTDASSLDSRWAPLVWRVAQEAVRNTLRHADAGVLTITLQASAAGHVLSVTDDGRGYDVAAVRVERYGMRGLASLAADSGAELAVDSSPTGTTVTLTMPATEGTLP